MTMSTAFQSTRRPTKMNSIVRFVAAAPDRKVHAVLDEFDDLACDALGQGMARALIRDENDVSAQLAGKDRMGEAGKKPSEPECNDR